MAKQVINIGTVANDGTGDPLRTAFDKVNDNFTELYSDDAGDVDSVNGQTGTVVLDSDDISEGTTNKYLLSDSVSYAKLAPEFTDSIAQNDLSFGTETIHTGTITGAVTLNITGVSQGVTKTAVFTGGTSLAFGPANTNTIIAGEYDPAVTNFIQIFNAGGVFPTADLYITISQPV